MESYGVKPASFIKNLSVKAKKVETGKDFNDKFDYCIGYDAENMYVVEFGIKGTDNYKKYFFPVELKSAIRSLGNKWIDHPILNRSGLAAIVWDPEKEGKTPNELRRRLENKALRGSFTEEEKSVILQSAIHFLNEIRNAFNIRV